MDWFKDVAWPWVEANAGWLGGIAAGSVVLFFVSLLAVPFIVVRLPVDHFVPTPPGTPRRGSVLVRSLRIIAGSFLVVAGVLMLVLPGQGLLTILLGLIVLDGPWNARLEAWVVRRDSLMRGLNWIRRRAHRPPFERPAPAADAGD